MVKLWDYLILQQGVRIVKDTKTRNTTTTTTTTTAAAAATYTASSSSSLAYGPYSTTSAPYRMIAHADLSSAFFLHHSTPIDFTSSQYSPATLGLIFHLIQ